MATTVAAQDEIAEVWVEFKKDISNRHLRNRLVERYLPLVKYNGERIWARLPDGVELDDLISAGLIDGRLRRLGSNRQGARPARDPVQGDATPEHRT